MIHLSGRAVDDAAAAQRFADTWEGAWNAHDPDAVAALCAEDIAFDDPALGQTVYGRGPMRNFATRLVRNYPDYRFDPEGVFADVARRAVLVAWSFTGTLSGTDSVIAYHGDDRLLIGEDGLITAYRCLYDNNDVLTQVRRARSR
ncbi:MAG TPA: nuclear transport factor 2 family protein [Mycobacterium sp.]|uniref:nuclear transport factor 2 family protein n=1 Tax=Mycolicibacterium sp. TaxID=2320850 RepID=UPI0025CDF727|nr:nuclear transport factor 2 family protein [Mycolicibacterium sp.]HPX36740.1 nuclear transport factor 2 family protein [Mycobacterium sp.]HQC76714.1 nuclear transport factor 2 family protein [Mycobacterium sp.]